MIELIGLILGVVGLVVAIGALLVGVYHVYGIRKHFQELTRQTEQARALTQSLKTMQAQQELQAIEAKTHTKALDTLRRELPTRYIGQFPEYLDEIVDVLEKGNKELVVFCDFPAYSSFSNPRRFLKYKQILEQKLNDGIPIQLTCLNGDCRMKITREQFLRQPTWDEWTRNAQNAERLERFLKHHSKKMADVSETEFIDLLERDDAGMLESIKQAGATVFEVDKNMPLYYWLADNEEAIFAIVVLSEKAVEYGFRTSDQQLINALNEMRDYYHR